MKRIIVDTDACPVKKEILDIGNELQLEVIFIASYSHYMNHLPNATILYVDSSDQSVDLFIANIIKDEDIVVTDDYGLASLVLRKKVKAISFRGHEYTKDNIDMLLEKRHLSLKSLRSGKKIKGPKPFAITDRENFVENLREILKS